MDYWADQVYNPGLNSRMSKKAKKEKERNNNVACCLSVIDSCCPVPTLVLFLTLAMCISCGCTSAVYLSMTDELLS